MKTIKQQHKITSNNTTMVKNTKGGKHKAAARKYTNAPKSVLRLSSDPLEIYAIITKIYGRNCQVTTVDELSLQCVIRNKFKGRNKKSNIICVNSIVLIGLREFESTQKLCDLLEVYDDNDVAQLRNIPSSRIHVLDRFRYEANASNNNDNKTKNNDDVLFSNVLQNDFLEKEDNETTNNDATTKEINELKNNDVFDFDCI